MQPTQIKINKEPNGQKEPSRPLKNILNLNDSPTKARTANSGKKYLWLLLALVAVEGAAIAWLYFLKPASPYLKLLPPETIFSAYFNQTALIDLLKTQKDANAAWPPLVWSDNALKEFLSQAKIDQPAQILPLFSDPMALAILSKSSGAGSDWLLLASLKAPSDTFSQARDKAEQSLKQNFNLVNESYRQVEISQVQPLKKIQNSFFYAQTDGYFIATNNNDLLKSTLDKIIK